MWSHYNTCMCKSSHLHVFFELVVWTSTYANAERVYQKADNIRTCPIKICMKMAKASERMTFPWDDHGLIYWCLTQKELFHILRTNGLDYCEGGPLKGAWNVSIQLSQVWFLQSCKLLTIVCSENTIYFLYLEQRQFFIHMQSSH